MEPSLELRKLQHSYKNHLIELLDAEESWKKLMAKIPKSLEKENFACDITRQNHAKYNSQHFKLVEKVSSDTRRSCTMILLRDWETSGRVHATLGHLLHILIRAELYGAADYVAVELLKQQPPRRPSRGPAALMVDIKPPKPENKNEEIEKILDQINYPNSIIEDIIKMNSNQNKNVVKPDTPPAIIISESPDEDVKSDMFIPLVIQNQTRQNISSNEDNNASTAEKCDSSGTIPQISALMKGSCTGNIVSDMIQFSTNSPNDSNEPDATPMSVNLSENLPCLSGLMNTTSQRVDDSVNNNTNSSNETSTQNIPQLSALIDKDSTNDSFDSSFIPNLSALSQEATSCNISFVSGETPSSSTNSSNSNVPCLSNLMNDSEVLESDMIPHLSALNTLDSCVSSNVSRNSPCISPLPNLSLDTHIPHFTYEEILKATDDFSMIDHKDGGKFLGSGAFGSVYLATGLNEKPLAVKKLKLTNENQVDENDMVTRQFRNEVEILSRYMHVNILSLIGYSCDGCTYCLLYEYLPGGALSDRLKASENILTSIERMNIAIGTAKGISYLHTAHAKPLIHRDIKSANILLDSRNHPKVCDFGLIKLAPDQNTSLCTTIIGTSAYMSPEAFRGDISVKVDTFSFGVVVLELLTSLPPVDDSREGRDLVTHVTDICEDEVGPLLDKNGGSWVSNEVDYAQELYKIALKCLEEKRQRPNMVEVCRLLGEIVEKINEQDE